jgi:hypothetical protein
MATAEGEVVALLLDASVEESFEQADVPMIARVAKPAAAIALRLAEFIAVHTPMCRGTTRAVALVVT